MSEQIILTTEQLSSMMKDVAARAIAEALEQRKPKARSKGETVLTPAKIESMRIPRKGETDTTLQDRRVPGLSISASYGGTKLFFVRIRSKGQQGERFKIGRYPDIDLATARAAAFEVLSKLEGDAPSSEILVEAGTTIQTLWNRYFEAHLKKTKSYESTLWYYNKHIKPTWSQRTICSITREQIQRWVCEVGQTSGTATANRAFICLAACINWAERFGIIHLDKNPVKGIEKFKVKERTRFLQPGEEFDKFWEGLAKYASQDLYDATKLSYLTGARCRANVCSMEWQHINLETGLWDIPGTKMKNDEHYTTAIPEEGLAILRRRRALIPESCRWVFPSNKSRSGHVGKPRRFKAVLKRIGIEDFTMHDVRRSAASHLALANFSETKLARFLGHKDPRSTRIYTRLNLTSQRESTNFLNGKLTTQPSQKRNSNVYQLKKDSPNKDGQERIAD